MPLLNFKKEFANMIITGEKKQTIRGERKHALKVGDTLYLYTGLMHKNSKKLLETTIKRVRQIEITETYLGIDGAICDNPDDFARLDGFNNFKEMKTFFIKQYALPFFGIVIEW